MLRGFLVALVVLFCRAQLMIRIDSGLDSLDRLGHEAVARAADRTYAPDPGRPGRGNLTPKDPSLDVTARIQWVYMA